MIGDFDQGAVAGVGEEEGRSAISSRMPAMETFGLESLRLPAY